MKLKLVYNEWYQDYKVPSMFLVFPHCSFKCDNESGERVCQNSTLAKMPDQELTYAELWMRYKNNPITKAVVCGGLEPMDDFGYLYGFIANMRFGHGCQDEVVIYTGYTEKECEYNGWLYKLRTLGNIIVKFGRYIPNQRSHFDNVLGVNLASDNQYAKRIS